MPSHEAVESLLQGYPARTLISPEAELEVSFVPSVGMVGASMRHRGEELLGQRGGLARYEATRSTMGIPLLHPWANRLDGLTYAAAGLSKVLDLGRIRGLPARLPPRDPAKPSVRLKHRTHGQ